MVSEAAPKVVLHEDFEHGLDQQGWRVYGAPIPHALKGQGRNGTTGFNNNGDRVHASGVVYPRMLETGQGLTIEYWSRVPLTGATWQEAFVGLMSAPPVAFQARRGSPLDSTVEYQIHAVAPETGDPVPETIALGLRKARLPAALRDGRWHRFRLVLYPSGELRWFSDGRELVEPSHLDITRLRRATLDVGGRSVATLAMMDDITVWEGVHLDPPERGGRRRR